MKKSRLSHLAYIFLITMLLLALAVTPAFAADIAVFVNGEQLVTDVAPVVQNGRTLVPMRAICEKLGAAVDFNSADQSVTVRQNDSQLVLFLNSTKAMVNGTETQLDVPPTVIEQRTLLPLRFLGENLNCNVSWLAAENKITVDAKKPEPKAADDISQALLAYINARRAALGLAAWQTVQPLDDMAFAQARHCARSAELTHLSAAGLALRQRAAQAGLSNVSELLSQGSYDAQSIWNEWIEDSAIKDLLYSDDIYFAGIYACYDTKTGADGLYVCMELIEGESFFVHDRSAALKDQNLLLHGYSTAEACIVLYTLDPADAELYVNRKSYYAEPNEKGAFELQLKPAPGGIYKICTGNDQLSVDLR